LARVENGFGFGVLSTTVWKGLVAVAKAENRATLVLLGRVCQK
jgi:hypothetical protein